MSLLKDFLAGFAPGLFNNKSVMTEDDILKAIDDLPDEKAEDKPAEEPGMDLSGDWYEGANWVKVPKPKCWSEFKYLGKPEFKGLPDISDDERIYFTIPCGFEWDQSVKFWFITFPASCDDSEVKDFFTVVNPIEA